MTELRAKPKANGAPRTETSVRGTYKALAKVMRYALAHRYIAHNPCAVVRRPRADTREARLLSVGEVHALSRLLDSQHPYGLLVRFMAVTGVRAGEAAALRLRDLDLARGPEQDSYVLVRLSKTHTSQGYITDRPKSARSVRDIPIRDDGLVNELREYRAQHPHRNDLEAALWPGKVPGHNRVSYSYALDPKGFYRYTYKPAARALGMPELKLHELRHTFATLALESGALSMHELSRAMGHAFYAVTDKVYSHLSRRSYAKARANFSAAMSSGEPSVLRAIT